MLFKQIVGDIFDSDAKYLVHQTNVTTKGKASGIAGIIFSKFPYSDCYLNRQQNSVPGTIDIRGNGSNNRFIINLMGQYNPGKPVNQSNIDSKYLRECYFVECLDKLSLVSNLQSVVFPAGIGCDLAGGDWGTYKKYIYEFYLTVNEKQNVNVSIVCLQSNVNKFNFEET